MKKFILFFIFSFLMTSFSYGQWGLKVGAVGSSMSTKSDEVTEKNARAGFTAGVVYNRCLGCSFSLQTELNYTQKGQSFNVSDYRITADLAYLDLPINIKWEPISPLYVYVGPQFSYLISDIVSLENDGTSIPLNDPDQDDYIDKLDIGLNAGIGFLYKKFYIETRITKGWRNVDHNLTFGEDNIIISEKELKNYTGQLTLGYYFN